MQLYKEYRFFLTIWQADYYYAMQFYGQDCLICGKGRFNEAHYERKPRGLKNKLIEGLSKKFNLRYSFCCSSCRRRFTPESLRFMGRKVYYGFLVLLETASSEKDLSEIIEKKLEQFRDIADSRTLKRWKHWWKCQFTAGGYWKEMKARFMPPLKEDNIPGELLRQYKVTLSTWVRPLQEVLLFLRPITGGLRTVILKE